MAFPIVRPRRLRRTETIRRMVRETGIQPSNLIYPMFVRPGRGLRQEIPSMPGNFHLSPDTLVEEVRPLAAAGLPAVILFGVPDRKDERGSAAYDHAGAVQEAIARLKDALPDLVVITDVCLCAYTDHGHCGVVKDGRILNDETLELLARMAVSHARAGADMVAPSDMMDGRVGAIRQALDDEGFSDVAIMAYSAKYASAFYGPFRDAAHSAPGFGDRRSYQMDPANAREALRELELDLDEGADILMVKPAMPYLDVIRSAREVFDVPIAAYQVSGEYAMIKAAAERGWLDEQAAALEALTAIRRAGADLILTYFAPQVLRWLA
ncbi:MAG: porphobilinogen synthase [Thermaerobacter sp.]|nr:porphobilinogen synthase [Bacillota bacterium]REJ38167.1 MAG: porphobilinogen synthase [Bacillota bacterium]